jgi:hypothetical protein
MRVEIEPSVAHRHHVDAHATAGSPLIRTRTGGALRHPALMPFAREVLTKTKGLTPRIL